MEKLQADASRRAENQRLTDWYPACFGRGMSVTRTCGVKTPTHIDAGRLLDVIDGLQALSETESRHLSRCKQCLETARLAAREVVRRRRELRMEESRRTIFPASSR
jgi:hypothetical protein